MNFLAAELALRLEWLDCWGLSAGHLPGALNISADYLSRLAAPGEPKAAPACLEGAKRLNDKKVVRTNGFYVLPSPVAAPALWRSSASDVWAAVKYESGLWQ